MRNFQKTLQFLYYIKLQNDLVLLGESKDSRRILWKYIEGKRKAEGNTVAFQYIEELRIEYEQYQKQGEENDFNSFARKVMEHNREQERE